MTWLLYPICDDWGQVSPTKNGGKDGENADVLRSFLIG